MSDFPLLFTVGHRVYAADSVDEYGNAEEGWGAPIEKPVYGWGAPQGVEPKVAGHERVEVEVELLVPPDFGAVSSRDRVILDGVEYDVIGPTESFDHNPFGWNPGGVINLKVVKSL
ncbi:head-to-tail stopper [Gordonia phage Ecliptus]|nr:head-to-tail stopper [Gordonia phage ODay]WAB10575.1 head-to-tail stopper [Gordonia phage Ecliptus]